MTHWGWNILERFHAERGCGVGCRRGETAGGYGPLVAQELGGRERQAAEITHSRWAGGDEGTLEQQLPQ